MSTKTFMAKKELVKPDWFVIDAEGEIVGHLATKIATILMGKHKPEFTPHVVTGDCIIILNVGKVRFSGKITATDDMPYMTKKMGQKQYDYYTGWPGGRRIVTAEQMIKRNPGYVLREAVRRMLPKNKLASIMLTNLRLFTGSTHTHQAQQPQELPAWLKG